MSMAKKKAKKVGRRKFNPTRELLDWIKEIVLLHLNDPYFGHEAYWSHLQNHVWRSPNPPVEWVGLTYYAQRKAFNLVLDELTEKRVIHRTKSYRPYRLLNPLDLIVEALNEADRQPPTDGVETISETDH